MDLTENCYTRNLTNKVYSLEGGVWVGGGGGEGCVCVCGGGGGGGGVNIQQKIKRKEWVIVLISF